MNAGDISVVRRGDGVSIDYAGEEFVGDMGIGLPINGHWLWTFDRSLKLVDEGQGTGRDRLGNYSYVVLSYGIPGMNQGEFPHLQQELRLYNNSQLLIETTVLEDIRGTYLEDSFYNTTFNSPVLRFEKDLNFIAYTWGLMGVETSRDGGHFPEAITGRRIPSIPSKLLLAGYSSREDLHTTSRKPFGPLVLYDDQGKTLVVSPFNHFLTSPLRTIETPSGIGVARGLHGSVDLLPRGTNIRTALVFGSGVVETMIKWGDWLLKLGGKRRDPPLDNPLLGSVGFWNCFGGYYTELFRQADEKVLMELAEYFQEEAIPVGYFGLDLWYNYGQVGFARNYSPDARKYPRGLTPIHRETGLPYLLHMSAFESPNDYVGRYEFAVDQSASYPMQREFYERLARDFKEQGAFGIWPDFLRTQMQNSRSLRESIGNADRWFDGFAQAFGDQEMVMMMCMPTIGHYLASTKHQNIIAVRTHSDFLNHQKKQVEQLQATGQVRNILPLQQSIRHNVLLSLLAHCLGLSPSFDVFLTNRAHPEGFDEPDAAHEALLRAMSAGVVAIGDKVGFVDKEIVRKLCFPDGRTSRPDHPPLPVVSTLQSEVLAFYTTATVGTLRWVYLALFNVGEGEAHYKLDLHELSIGQDAVVFDYFTANVLHTSTLEGDLGPAHGHYYVIVPQVSGFHFLGFPDKYITVSTRQVASIQGSGGEVTVDFRLPLGPAGLWSDTGPEPPEVSAKDSQSTGIRPADGLYTVAAYAPSELEIKGIDAQIRGVRSEGGLLYIDFAPRSENPSITFYLVNRPDLA